MRQRTREGLLTALIAYTLWGFLPIYFKVVEIVPASEVLAHRILWAVPFGLPIVLLRRQWPEVIAALRSPRTLGLLALSAAVIAINWVVYIWAVQNDRIFQASLGYYINPLIYVLVGVVLFSERLRRRQTAAVLLAAAGVTVLAVSGREFPLISLTLATTFTIYGTIRSRVAIGGMPGLFIETLLLFPGALFYVLWLTSRDAAAFGSGD
ncbi:MAG: EamA family transporter RarD, partial [Gammaproteobacteria bacterium]|nr:EamA family transporter RarD [Gammaproteobacteria bacterium]